MPLLNSLQTARYLEELSNLKSQHIEVSQLDSTEQIEVDWKTGQKDRSQAAFQYEQIEVEFL